MARHSGESFARLVGASPDIRRSVLSALVIGVPVVFLRFTVDPFNVPKLTLLTLGVAVVVGLRAMEILLGRTWRELSTLAIPAGLLTAPLLLSWALSPYREWAVLGLQGRFQGLIPYLIVILFGLLIADAFRGRADELAIALLWAGAIVGGYAVLQTVGADPFNWSLYGAPTEAVSTTGNPNFTGGFLGIVLPVGIGLVLTDPTRRRVAARLLVLTVMGWLVARSQGGWAAGVAGSAILGGYLLRDRYRLAHVAGWVLAATVALVTVGVVLVAMVRPESRFTTSASLVRSRWSQASFGMGLAHPLAGRGPNSFAIEGVRHRTLEDALLFNFDFPDDPHSVPMSMFANLGLPGLVGFLGILAWALWFFIRTSDPSLLQVAFAAAVVAYFVQSLVSIDEITLRVGLWAALGGSVAASFAEERKKVPAKKNSKAKRSSQLAVTGKRPLAMIVAVAVMLLGSIAWAMSILVADVFARQGSRLLGAGDVPAGTAKYELALSLRDSADYHGRLAFALKARAIDDQGTVDDAVFVAADEQFSFTEEIPYVFSIVGRARLLEEEARARGVQSERATELYRRALELDPHNPQIRIELARVLLRGGRPDDAVTVLTDLKAAIGQRVPEFWGVLALSATRAGELDLGREAADIAISLSPGQADATAAIEILDKGKR